MATNFMVGNVLLEKKKRCVEDYWLQIEPDEAKWELAA